MGIDDESSHPALCSEVANGGLSAGGSTLAYLDILLEQRYAYLECLLKNRMNGSNCCRALWTY